MEIKQRLVLKENLDSNIRSNDTLMSPEPGVAYVRETEKVYFNRAVLPQGGSHPEIFDVELAKLNRPQDIEG